MKYTEEEKKVIEFFEKRQKYMGNYRGPLEENTDIILNLIEKKQKEIEEKDKRIFYLENEAGKIIEEELNNAKVDLYRNFIPKEAIREKIDDLQRYKGLVMYEKYNYDAIIRYLKELLGE